jgi:TIR domain/AAA domain, putative AbiEii toxin, Type IV TA system
MATTIQPRSVFLSYSRSDREIAEKFVRALEHNGISVWWDYEQIPIGAAVDEFLSNQLQTSACVVVLWSHSSVKSAWVLDEAAAAAERRVLIPVLIEDVEIPLRFVRIHAASLIGWDGEVNHPDLRRIMKSVATLLATAPSSADETRMFKQSQRSAERRAQEFFQRNLRSESTLEHFDLAGTSFYDELSWNLNSGINILLGRNGYGKTYLLRSLIALLQYHDDAAQSTLRDGRGSISLLQSGEEQTINFSDHFFEEEGAVGKLPVLAIPDMRFVNRSVTTLGPVSDETTGKGDRTDLASFGAWHFLEERPYDNMIQRFLYGLCLDFIELQKFEGEIFDLVGGVARELTDQSFAFDRVAREGRDRFTLYVRSEGNESNPLPIQKASQGTLSVVSMFGLIYDFLKSLRQDEVSEVCNRRGIVVIDEVDAHLHPMWQQKLVGLLRNRFPRVQFILTAHNPIVVAGCLEDEVSVLRKASNRGFSLFQFPNDFIGWQTEEIYKKVFGIENPDDTFAHFDAMRPFKAQLEQQAAGLASQSHRNHEEDQTLDEIEDKILYIEKAEDVRSRRLTQEELDRENRSLQERLLGLESARLTVVEQQHQLDRVTRELRQSNNALEHMRRNHRRNLMAVSLLASILLGVFAAILVGRSLGWTVTRRPQTIPGTPGGDGLSSALGVSSGSGHPDVPSPATRNSWGVRVSADENLNAPFAGGPSALWEVELAAKAGYPDSSIFHHGKYYWTVIHSTDEQSARSELQAIRTQHPHWAQATAKNVTEWCPGASELGPVTSGSIPTRVFECNGGSPVVAKQFSVEYPAGLFRSADKGTHVFVPSSPFLWKEAHGGWINSYALVKPASVNDCSGNVFVKQSAEEDIQLFIPDPGCKDPVLSYRSKNGAWTTIGHIRHYVGDPLQTK